MLALLKDGIPTEDREQLTVMAITVAAPWDNLPTGVV